MPQRLPGATGARAVRGHPCRTPHNPNSNLNLPRRSLSFDPEPAERLHRERPAPAATVPVYALPQTDDNHPTSPVSRPATDRMYSMQEKLFSKLTLGLGWWLVLFMLGIAAGTITLTLAIVLVPWLAVPLLATAIVWWSPPRWAHEDLRKHFTDRGMTVDKVTSISRPEQLRLGAPKKALIIRYHDNDAVEYWAMAAIQGGKVEILRDVPRQVYESQKPPWKPGNAEIDLDILIELAKPSAAQQYFKASMVAALEHTGGSVRIDEHLGLPVIPDTPSPVSFASLLQLVQITCRTAQATGSAQMTVHGKETYVLEFTCVGEQPHRTLTLTLRPGEASPDAPHDSPASPAPSEPAPTTSPPPESRAPILNYLPVSVVAMPQRQAALALKIYGGFLIGCGVLLAAIIGVAFVQTTFATPSTMPSATAPARWHYVLLLVGLIYVATPLAAGAFHCLCARQIHRGSFAALTATLAILPLEFLIAAYLASATRGILPAPASLKFVLRIIPTAPWFLAVTVASAILAFWVIRPLKLRHR
jgi:hypothetical protein